MAKKPIITVNDKTLIATVDSEIKGVPHFLRVESNGVVTDGHYHALRVGFKNFGKEMFFYNSWRNLFSEFLKHQLKIAHINAKIVPIFED